MRNMYVEYLRMVFISFIVLLHILWNDYGGINVSSTSHALCTYTQLGLTNMVGLGVTGFILISGYYGVNLKMNRLVSLWLQTTVYSLLSVVILCVINNDGGLFRGLLDSLLSLFDGWWFVSYYLVLMLLSPLIIVKSK